MAVANGYGKVVTSGSVFMYDTGDFYNSYKGQPGTNITTGAGRNYDGYNITTYSPGVFFETNGYTEVVNIPSLGPTTVQSIEINNSAPGVSCCPNLFNYTGNWMSPIWLPGQTYSYQIIYKCRSGYTHPNFMYHYEYTSGEGYLTEYGVFTTDKQESLGDGWYHAWNTFTTHPFAAKGYTGLWYYQYYVADKISIAAVSISPGDTIRPPQQIIPSGTTRSATQGLLPIVGDSPIDLSNVSFTSNAQMTFDGTDDRIDVFYYSPVDNTMSRSWEVIVKPTTTLTYAGIFGNKLGEGCAYYCNGGIYLFDGNWVFNWYDNSSYQFLYSGVSPTANQYFHIVGTYDATDQKPRIYVNGELKATYGSATNMDYGGATYVTDIGWNSKDGGLHYFQGQIPITKYYQNKALSAAEVKQNYNKYKTRFNLS